MADRKLWKTNDKGIKIYSMSKDKLKDALALMRHSYYPDEPVSVGIRLREHPEAIDDLEFLTVEMHKDEVSVIAEKDGVLVGALFNKIQIKSELGKPGFFEVFKNNQCKTDPGKEYMNVMITIDSKFDVYQHYRNIDKSLEMVFLVTAKEHRGQGIGKLLMSASEDVARDRSIKLVTAICSNIGTLKICTSLNWDKLGTSQMSDFQYKGQPFSLFTGEHQTLTLVGKLV